MVCVVTFRHLSYLTNITRDYWLERPVRDSRSLNCSSRNISEKREPLPIAKFLVQQSDPSSIIFHFLYIEELFFGNLIRVWR